MVIKGFTQFLIRESLDAARKFLDKTISKEDEASQKLFRKTFDRIIKKLGKKIGWSLLFTRFYFQGGIGLSRLFRDENTPEIGALYDRLSGINPGDLPRQLDVYPNLENGFEILSDDLRDLEETASVKDFIQNLPGQFVVTNKYSSKLGQTIPSMKDEFRRMSPEKKREVIQLAVALRQSGEAKYKAFIQKVKRYGSLSELITAGKKYLLALNLEQEENYLEKIRSLPENFVEVLFDRFSIYIVKVDSFFVNQRLHGMTSHCIVKDVGYWNTYYLPENTQYYITNFNLDSSDPLSVIGATVYPNGKFKTIHSKFDKRMSTDELISYLDRLEKEFRIDIDLLKFLKPITYPEILVREKRKEANTKIKKTGLSLVEIQKLLEEGADPNGTFGEPLKNAINENNIEKVECLLQSGADPNIIERELSFGNVFSIKSKEIFFLLIRYGLKNTSTKTLFRIYDDFSKRGVEYLVKEIGIESINRFDGHILRKSVVREEVDSVRWLLQKGADPTVRGGEPIHLAIDKYKKIEKISPEQAKKVLDIIGLLYNSLETSEIGRKIIQGISKSPDRLEILNKLEKKFNK